jgi:hypothetical protein
VRRAAALALPLVVLAVACGSKGPKSPVGVDDERPRVLAKKPKPPRGTLHGHVLTSVGDRVIGPYLARRTAKAGTGETVAGLASWVTPPEGVGRRLVVVALDPNGEPRGGERTVAHVPIDTTALAIGALRGTAPGFLVAWTSLTDRGEALWAAAIGDDGVPRGKAVELARTTDDIVWLGIVATDAGAVCLWAEETRGGDANLSAAALDGHGHVKGAPASVAHGVTGWHALEIPDGLAVSSVVPPRGVRAGGVPAGARGGTLSFQRLDAEAHPSAPPVIVADKPTVSGDVEVARRGDGFVFAWTDRTGDEPFVAAAAVDAKGNVEPPRKVVDARGGSALLHVASGPAGAALLWEAPVRAKGEGRRVHVGRFGDGLALERKRFAATVVGRAVPELTPTPDGFVVLGAMHDCELDDPTCDGTPVVATLLRLDRTLELTQREPFHFAGDPALVAWGVRCHGRVCSALSASGTSPTRIRSAEVRPRVNVKRKPIPAPPTGGPQVVDVTAFATGETVVDLAATPMGEDAIVASLSETSDSSSALVLATRVLSASGATSPPVILTKRALGVGGVAIASAGKEAKGGAVAWVALDNGDPEVHVTRIDSHGRRTGEIQLTRTKGDATDVAIAWAEGGWIVAWVDGRDGNGEVYATKLGPELQRSGRDERITNARGDASDLAALVRGDKVWLAWADSRRSRDGVSDVYVSAVSTRDAKRTIDELHVQSTSSHSRTPHLAPAAEGGVHLTWIEEAPLGIDTPSSGGYGALWATIDAEGKLVARPIRLPLSSGGAATSVAIEAHGGTLRAVVTRGTDDAIALDAVDLGTVPPRAFPLLTLDGPPSLDVVLVLHEGVVLFNDDGPMPSDRRARRAKVAWRR